MFRRWPQRLDYEAYHPSLTGCGFNQYSQYGEDGLVSALFAHIGATNEWCFEIGAADGVMYSNTLQWRNVGWKSVLIEADADQFIRLQAQFESPDCICIHKQCTDLDVLLETTEMPVAPDFGVIDIDGQDYWLWHDLTDYTPRVMLVEFHWSMGEGYVPPRDINCKSQAGEGAMRRLASEKGYEVVAKTHVNLLCVRAECL